MREIKFRAWDKTYKRMIDADECRWQACNNSANTILMQFLGFKDKNNKEIYEGDILKLDDKIGVIWWQPSRCQFVVDPSKGLKIDILGNVNILCEVIGNIYENPELLKNPNDKIIQ